MLQNYNMDKLYNKALKLGASNFGISKTQNKRFYVIYNGRKNKFWFKSGAYIYRP